MSTSNAPQSLREHADALKSQLQPRLRQRKARESVPGLTTFSLAKPTIPSQTPLPPSASEQYLQSYTSGVDFRPPLTPQSLPRNSTYAARPPAISAPSPSFGSGSLSYDDPFVTNDSSDLLSNVSEQELEGLPPESFSLRRERLSTYQKIDRILAELRHGRISPVDVLIQVLDSDDISYDRYRGHLYREDSGKLMELVEKIMGDDSGQRKLLDCMRPHLQDFACETVSNEMESLHDVSILPKVSAVTAEFIENFNLDENLAMTPFLTSILTSAAQSERAKDENKLKHPEKMVQVVTRQLLYQYSNRCLAFPAEFGLFLWSTGSARQTIDAAHRCSLSVSYDSVLKHIESLGDACTANNIAFASDEDDPHGLGYDNVNIPTSEHTEQRGADGPAKVRSGSLPVLYGLLGAKREHMLIAPIMRRLKDSPGLHFNRDLQPSIAHLQSYHHQLETTTIHCLFTYVSEFDAIAKDPQLQHKPIRPIPVGYKTRQYPLRASTIEEATTRGNILLHDEIYINQLKQTPERLSKYAIPSFNDQLTNARIRSAQQMRVKDKSPWERREIFQLGFGLFHLCLNLVWGILHIHRGSVNDVGSLTYFFSLMEKKRLGNDQPDYHALLAALTQALHGLLLNAWAEECGFASLKLFAESNPSPETLRKLASQILAKYATPLSLVDTQPEAYDSPSDTSDSDSDTEDLPIATNKAPPPLDPKDDIAHHNIRLLTRDLLMVEVLVRAISDGDFGRVEVLLPHLALMFRGAGCNKYCTEILHFLHNLKHVWTPEFADIMRDNMIVCISGLGPGHCMGIDMNIEHLIGYLKNLLRAKGMDSTWDRLGNISAAIIPLQNIKKKMGALLSTSYQRGGHTTPDTSKLVWRVQEKVASERLQEFESGRANNIRAKLTKDICKVGEQKLKSSTLNTFNKKLRALIDGLTFEEEEDECPAMQYDPIELDE
ncbi:hypothetical protein R3P38DRAFT_3203850 [Favolaschia claudopus]|uniref:DUF6589 domain-containing protein n=1 Tax=Favolaschia claudopus TaxID=2862362 RepID=A0AAW0ARN6_9AGAR